MTVKKVRMRPEMVDGYNTILHPETSANITLMPNGDTVEELLRTYIPNPSTMILVEVPLGSNVEAIFDSIIETGWYICRVHIGQTTYQDIYVQIFESGGVNSNEVLTRIFYDWQRIQYSFYSTDTQKWSDSILVTPGGFASKSVVTGTASLTADVTSNIELGFRPRYVKVLVDIGNGNGMVGELIGSSGGILQSKIGGTLDFYSGIPSSLLGTISGGFRIKISHNSTLKYVAFM